MTTKQQADAAIRKALAQLLADDILAAQATLTAYADALDADQLQSGKTIQFAAASADGRRDPIPAAPYGRFCVHKRGTQYTVSHTESGLCVGIHGTQRRCKTAAGLIESGIPASFFGKTSAEILENLGDEAYQEVGGILSYMAGNPTLSWEAAKAYRLERIAEANR